jgi:hypothetical protein
MPSNIMTINRPNNSELEMTNIVKADGFTVTEKAGNNLIVGKMLKFTIDSKYKVDKADRRRSNGQIATMR